MLRPQKGNLKVSFNDTVLNFGLCTQSSTMRMRVSTWSLSGPMFKGYHGESDVPLYKWKVPYKIAWMRKMKIYYPVNEELVNDVRKICYEEYYN